MIFKICFYAVLIAIFMINSWWVERKEQPIRKRMMKEAWDDYYRRHPNERQ